MAVNTDTLSSGSLSPSVLNTLKNTYLLLGISLLFSVMTGFASHAMGFTGMLSSTASMLAVFAVQIGIIFMVTKNANKGSGLFWIMLFAGVEGFILDPVISASMHIAPGAVTTALAMTAAVTFAMSFTAFVTKRDLSFMRGFLIAGLVVIVTGSLVNLFIGSSAFALAISAAGAMVFSLFILYDTQKIVRGEETNYISATLSLYLGIINLFLSLLRLVTAFSGSRD